MMRDKDSGLISLQNLNVIKLFDFVAALLTGLWLGFVCFIMEAGEPVHPDETRLGLSSFFLSSLYFTIIFGSAALLMLVWKGRFIELFGGFLIPILGILLLIPAAKFSPIYLRTPTDISDFIEFIYFFLILSFPFMATTHFLALGIRWLLLKESN